MILKLGNTISIVILLSHIFLKSKFHLLKAPDIRKYIYIYFHLWATKQTVVYVSEHPCVCVCTLCVTSHCGDQKYNNTEPHDCFTV